jgi:hypothetical protein
MKIFKCKLEIQFQVKVRVPTKTLKLLLKRRHFYLSDTRTLESTSPTHPISSNIHSPLHQTAHCMSFRVAKSKKIKKAEFGEKQFQKSLNPEK